MVANNNAVPSWFRNHWASIEFQLFEKQLAETLDLERKKCADAYIRTPLKSILIEHKASDFYQGIRQLDSTYKALKVKGFEVAEIVFDIQRIKPPASGTYKFLSSRDHNGRHILYSQLSGKWQQFTEIGKMVIFNDYVPPDKKK